MQKVFDELYSLDTRCREKFFLTEDIMMEHASQGMMEHIEKRFPKKTTVFIMCGPGNNGADGIVLARLLYPRYKISLYIPFGVSSNAAKKQLQRAQSLGIRPVLKISKADVIVDCLFGAGQTRKLDKKTQKIIDTINKLKGYKIACDISTGINTLGQIETVAFNANTTLTMGGLKKSLFTDIAKEYVGTIEVISLGIQRKLYETNTNCYLLAKKDIKLPFRGESISNKGTYGHLCVAIGEKKGAGLLCAEAGFSFGVGLLSVLSKSHLDIPHYMMQNNTLPNNTTALCIGMGLGKKYDTTLLNNSLPKVIDADLFYDTNILPLLKQKNIILTPHPKEFCSLLALTNIAVIDIETLQNNRFYYLLLFSKKYPNAVVLLKGTNVLIAQKETLFINSLGSAILSKGGSGDVLCGLIGALLAQGYSPLEAAINGSLAHTLAAAKYTNNNYAMTPLDLVRQIKKL